MAINEWLFDTCCFYDHDYSSELAAEYSTLGQYVVFGDLRAPFKIMTFGGSTTSTLQGSKWVKILSQMLAESGNNICLLNGGCGGHNSWNEMNKLLRDVGSFKPDLVISFSGINDAAAHTDPNNTYINTKGLKEVITKTEMFKGFVVPTTLDSHALAYVRRTRIMRSCCEDVGAAFERILQPTLGIGNYTPDVSDDDDVKCLAELQEDDKKFGYRTMLNNFYTGVQDEIAKEHAGFIRDFSRLFDGKSKLYADFRHPNERGYAIIAGKIAKLVQIHAESKIKNSSSQS